MSRLSRARRVGFWSLDRAKGNRVRSHYQDIRSRMHGDDDPGRIEAILRHATTTTSFYSPYRGAPLRDFPVISKKTYKAHFDELMSGAFHDERVHTVHTSGSTGTPFALVQNMDKRHRAIAEVIYFNERAGHRVGDKLLWLRAWTTENSKSALLRRIQNVIPIELVGMDDQLREDIVRTLRGGSVDAILGYSSALWSLTRYIERVEYDLAESGLRVIISGAEALSPTRKKRIQAAFGCPVVDRYANEENGVLATTMPDDDLFHLNRASYVFEFLEVRSDEPAEPGEVARVVVTDLYNKAMPMIRYDTGDLAVVARHEGGATPRLQSIEGRHADAILDTAGRELSASSVAVVMEGFPNLAQYQLVQEDASRYRLRVALGEAQYEADAFVTALLGLLGADAEVTVVYLDHIPTQTNAKFRTIMSEYQPVGPFVEEP